ncbi:MAG TPA: AMP-binding protein [Pseudonocardia sp.]|jgi:fatty-acyl-CoA synthase
MQRFPAPDWVAHHAQTRPDAVAVASADTGEQVSWRELEHRVGRSAAGLRARGLQPGDRLAVLADNDPRVFELQFAAMRAGVVLVPLNWRLAVEEMRHQCRDADVTALAHDRRWARAGLDVAATAGIERLIEIEPLAHGGEPPMDPTGPDPDTVTHILYTSGTTGRPKGATVTHASIMWNAFNIMGATQISAPGVHMLNPMPLFHAGGLNVLANPILMCGGRVTTMARWDPGAILTYLGDTTNAVTHLTTAPSLLQMLIDAPEFTTTDFATVRKIVIGGGACTPELLRTFAAQGIELHPQYGGTETGPAALVLDNEFDRALSGTCGKPVMHTQVRLVDPDTGTDVPIGTVGELWLKGPSVTPGYWKLPNAEHFVDGWFRTGDAARRDDQGYYYISGRYKDMYKTGGENVYAAEVENILAELPNVAEVAIIGVPDAIWGETGLAIVVPSHGRTVTLDELQQACRGRIANYKQPKHLQIVDALPRNATGKVSKHALTAQAGQRYADPEPRQGLPG